MESVVAGSCVACREYADLRRWKPTIFGERVFVWICSECRDHLTREELTAAIEWNIENLPILLDEQLITATRNPTPEDRAECRAVAEAARQVLEALDRWEADRDGGQ